MKDIYGLYLAGVISENQYHEMDGTNPAANLAQGATPIHTEPHQLTPAGDSTPNIPKISSTIQKRFDWLLFAIEKLSRINRDASLTLIAQFVAKLQEKSNITTSQIRGAINQAPQAPQAPQTT